MTDYSHLVGKMVLVTYTIYYDNSWVYVVKSGIVSEIITNSENAMIEIYGGVQSNDGVTVRLDTYLISISNIISIQELTIKEPQ